ncbi:chromosome partitioning protein [Chitinophaga skermanii]|uniref:Chromosome partitioning protein n=1 Tax=Chitinophaga skermanii TaxID=331697 RepID=A0A327Q560_9BACT|nr:ParA family protein [Chitinophaga skermanii]RAI96996.1 chromosome partitioning protein [Chitinophaga skermanii]
MGKIVAFAIQKGGAGKTTTTINLGFELANRGHKVLLCDLDPQFNLTIGLKLQGPGVNMYEALTGRIDHLPIVSINENLSIVKGSLDVAAAEVELINKFARESTLRELLEPVREDFDFIFLDCPPSLSILTINAMTAADEVYIPVQAEFYAMSGVDKLLTTMAMIKNKLNSKLKLGGVFITLFDGRKSLNTAVAKDVAKIMGEESILKTIIRDNVSLAEAPARGQSIFDYAPKSHGAEDYKLLADEFLSRQ